MIQSRFIRYVFSLLIILITLAGLIMIYRTYHHQPTADIIIHNGTIITMDPQRRIIDKGALAIKGDTIIAIGKAEILQQYSARTTIDAQGSAVLPGFVNGHTHTAMTLFRGAADDLTLDEWLHNHILPLEKKYVTPDFVYWGTVLGSLEMIRGGVTTLVDMYLLEGSAAQALSDIGMRAIAGYNIITQDDIHSTESYIKQWQHHALITPAVAPHSPYACTEDVLIAAKNLANKYNVPLTMHIAETEQSVEEVQKEQGLKPLPYLASIEFLSNKLIAAHLVKIQETDMDLLKKYDVGAIHNPTSNLKLSSGIAPVMAMLHKGIAVGLGTDGAASNNSLNLLSEIKLAALLQKVYTNDPRALDAQTALELATIRGAQAIHRDHEIGSIEVGKKADIIIISMDRYHQRPLYNIVSQIVFASESSDVATTIVNGKILMRDRELLYPSSLLDKLDERIKYYHDQIKNDVGQAKQKNNGA